MYMLFAIQDTITRYTPAKIHNAGNGYIHVAYMLFRLGDFDAAIVVRGLVHVHMLSATASRRIAT